MRGLAYASLLFLVAGCSAVDDFTRFKFVEDAGVTLTDLGRDMAPAVDMSTASGLPGFGQPCTTACDGTLFCAKEFTGKAPAPGGICTHFCGGPTAVGCTDVPDAQCVTLNGVSACMPRCNPMTNKQCRTGYLCCNGNMVTDTAGVCSPQKTDFCGQ